MTRLETRTRLLLLHYCHYYLTSWYHYGVDHSSPTIVVITTIAENPGWVRFPARTLTSEPPLAIITGFLHSGIPHAAFDGARLLGVDGGTLSSLRGSWMAGILHTSCCCPLPTAQQPTVVTFLMCCRYHRDKADPPEPPTVQHDSNMAYFHQDGRGYVPRTRPAVDMLWLEGRELAANERARILRRTTTTITIAITYYTSTAAAAAAVPWFGRLSSR